MKKFFKRNKSSKSSRRGSTGGGQVQHVDDFVPQFGDDAEADAERDRRDAAKEHKDFKKKGGMATLHTRHARGEKKGKKSQSVHARIQTPPSSLHARFPSSHSRVKSRQGLEVDKLAAGMEKVQVESAKEKGSANKSSSKSILKNNSYRS